MRFFRFLCLAYFLTLALGCGSSGGLSDQAQHQPEHTVGERIYAGDEVDFVSEARIVRIVSYLRNGMATSCSGTVIGPQAVLTATHCFMNDDIYAAGVRILGTEIPITEIHPHPGLRIAMPVVFNDVTVVKTETPIGIPPMPLLVSQPVQAGDDLLIFGYGLDEHNGIGVLKSGTINLDYATENHLIDRVRNGQNTCKGDSGGPALKAVNDPIQGEVYGLVGVTSSGESIECTNSDTSYYINLQEPGIMEFILSVVPEAQLL